MRIFRAYNVDASHHLPRLPAEHRCAHSHGHRFRIEVHVSGPADAAMGWVVDFAAIDGAVAPLLSALDHNCLNTVSGLENPTSEVLAMWLWERLAPELPGLCQVVVQESPDSGCVYEGVS